MILSITTKNDSANPLTGLFLEPLAVKFPEKPVEYDGNTPILGSNMGGPTVLKMTYGANALALVDEGAAPLMSDSRSRRTGREHAFIPAAGEYGSGADLSRQPAAHHTHHRGRTERHVSPVDPFWNSRHDHV